jgi:hypothetical protein
MSSQIKTPGMELNRLLDAMGFPDHIGDLYGTALDQAIRNDLGVARNFLDAFAGFKTNQLDSMLRRNGFTEAGHCPRPRDVFQAIAHEKKHNYYEREKIQKFNLGDTKLSAFAIDGKVVNIGESMSPAAFEARLRLDSDFRKKIEDQLDARIICDYKCDGSIKLVKRQSHFSAVLPMPQKALAELPKKYVSVINPSNVRDHRTSNIEVRDHRSTTSMAVRDHRTDNSVPSRESLLLPLYKALKEMDEQRANELPANQDSGNNSDLSEILKDPSMPFEQKLALFLFAYVDRKQKEIEKKAAALEQKKKAGENGGGGGGLLGTIGSIGGAALGGYFGGAAGVGIGSDIGGRIGNAFGGGGGTSSAGKEEDSEQVAMKKLQMEVEDMNKMFTLIDNILTGMNRVVKEGPIAALRG